VAGEGISIPKWAKADPVIASIAAITNTIKFFLFIFSSYFDFFGESLPPKKKPRVSGVSMTPNLRGSNLSNFLGGLKIRASARC
jgi:hypothetical protein